MKRGREKAKEAGQNTQTRIEERCVGKPRQGKKGIEGCIHHKTSREVNLIKRG